MTGEQLFRQAVALLGQELSDAAYLRTFALPGVNQLMWDTLRCQQALALSRGEAEQQTAPKLDRLSEEVPYETDLVCACFPYGLAALLVAEDDRETYNRFSTEFERRLKEYCPCEFREVTE